MNTSFLREPMRVYARDDKGLFVMLECYLDDSGTHDNSRVIVWGGIAGHQQDCRSASSICTESYRDRATYDYLIDARRWLADRERLLELAGLTRGSITCWCHINMMGEYDFRQEAANDDDFDLQKILAFTVT